MNCHLFGTKPSPEPLTATDDLLSFGQTETNFSDFLNKIQEFSFIQEIHLEMSSQIVGHFVHISM